MAARTRRLAARVPAVLAPSLQSPDDLLDRLGLRTSAEGVPEGHPDAKLIRLEAELDGITAAIADWDADRTDLSERQQDRLLDEFWDVTNKIKPLRARTQEGLRVKARTLRAVFDAVTRDEGHLGDHMHALIRDVLGESRFGFPVVGSQNQSL